MANVVFLSSEDDFANLEFILTSNDLQHAICVS